MAALRDTVVRAACFAAAILGARCAAAVAAEPRVVDLETREFKVSVDGTPRGTCTMQIRRRDDGTETLSIKSGLAFNYVVYNYRYSSTGNEVWKDGRLVALENDADFNGKAYRVKAGPADKGLDLTVNGKRSNVSADVWVTSYWQLPEQIERRLNAEQTGIVQTAGTRTKAAQRALAVSLLDSDKGRPLRGRVERLGEETLTVAGKRSACTHYRIGGDVEVELWYDSERRLVRQESVDSGHKSVLELTRASANSKRQAAGR